MYTQRLEIRLFKKSDFEDLLELMLDPLVLKNTGFRVTQTPEEIQNHLQSWIESSNDQYGKWCVVLRNTQEFVGWCMLVKKKRTPFSRIRIYAFKKKLGQRHCD